MRYKYEERKEMIKIGIVTLFSVGVCFLLYHFQAVLETGSVVTHFFYIPIVLAAMWWRRKGLIVAVLLAAILIFSHILLRPEITTINDFFRAGMFIVIAIVVSILSERIARGREALREERDKSQTYLNIARVMLVAINATGEVTLINKKGCEILGCEKSDILGKNWFDNFLPGRLIEEVKFVHADLIAGDMDSEVYYENPVLTKEGEERLIAWHNTVLIDDKGNIIGTLSSGDDITERKRAEEALKESEGKLDAMLQSICDHMSMMDKDLNIIWANETARNIFGNDIIGKKCYEVYHGRKESCEPYPCITLKAFQDGKVHEHETRVIGKDGKIIYFYCIANVALRDEDGKATAVLEISRDITERKQAEEALEESEETLSGIIKSIPDFMSIIDEDYNIVWANKVAKDSFGVDITEKKCYEAYHRIDKPCEHCIVREVLADGKVHEHEAKTVDKDGNTIYQLSIASVASRYTDGRPKTLIEVSRDITEHKQLEEQFRQAQKMEGIGRLAGGIAHDFNNLLTVIFGHAELASVSLVKQDPLHDDLKEIQNAANRAADLTRQLLAFSRKQTLQPKVLDLNDIIKELHKMLKRVIGEDIDLETIAAPDLWRVSADPGQIEQVIINLAVNARDAMPEGGKLTIETQNVELDEEYAGKHPDVTPGPHVMLAVSDTGCGMPDDVKTQIFEPFFTTKEKGKGTGLGLSMVYGVVKQSGGNIWVYSELGKGTTLKIYLPMITREADELSRETDVSGAPRGTETILVVEDEEGVRKLAVRILEKQGYKVLEAESGGDALVMCRKMQKPVDIVVTDVIMPHSSGAEFVKKLRELWSDVKVLYMSGYTSSAIVHAGVLDKSTPYLQKPFRPLDIALKVRSVLDSKADK